MKKYNWLVGMVLILLVILCFVFAYQRDVERKRMEGFCDDHAAFAYWDFKNYQSLPVDYLYIPAISNFYAFASSYQYLEDRSGTGAESTACQTIYHTMRYEPEKIHKHIPQLLVALEYLASDYKSADGFAILISIANELENSGN